MYQFLVAFIIFAAILVIIIISLVSLNVQINAITNRENTVSSIHNSANELNLILDDYIIYQNSSYIDLWNSQYSNLSANVNSISPQLIQQYPILANIQNNTLQLNNSFVSLTTLVQNTPRNQSIRVLPEFQNTWNAISHDTHDIIIDSESVSADLIKETEALHAFNNYLIVSMLVILGVYLLINFFIFYHRTLKSIDRLQKGLGVIGSGNLNYSIKTEKADEIGALSSSFNQMAANLRNVTTSKATLEEEIEKRKKVEKELERYSRNLEELVEQRTKQLKDSERLAAIGQIAGMVEHDIRNPLQAVIGELFLARQSMADIADKNVRESVSESINSIQEQVDYINSIVANLQDFTKPLKPELTRIDICQLIPESLKSIQIPNNIETRVLCPDGAIVIMLDRTFMRRILTNLVTNAIQAMPKGGKLTVEVTKNQTEAILTVEDTGAGIPLEARDKLFTPLFTTKAKGQGFGLVVVRRMTEAQKGIIKFESEVGKGTKFIISFPLK